jgi:type I restriction enzyme S subunit
MEWGVHYQLRVETLPHDWRVGHVGDFAKDIEPGFASGEHNQAGEGVAHLRPMNIDREGKIDLAVTKFVSANKNSRRLAVGDVLFNNTNSPELVGKTAVINASGDFAFSNHMTRIRFADTVLPKFGALQLHFLWMRGYFKYNCVKHVNQASVSSRALARGVPFVWAPPDQQERIVAEIEKQFSRLDEAVANLKRVKANLKRYAAATIRDAVTGRLVETEAEIARSTKSSYEPGSELLDRILLARQREWSGRGKCPNPTEPDRGGLAILPEGWAWASADQLSDFITKGTTPPAVRLSEGSGEVQFLKVYNLTFDGKLNHYYKPAFISRDTHENALARSKVRPGDVLINIVGPPLGQVSIVPNDLHEANINQAIARVRPVGPLDARFLAIALRSDEIMGWAIRRAKTTAGQSNLTLELCRALPVPLPPLAEQRRIVAEVDRSLSVISDTEAEVDANLKRAEALRQSILHRAFAHAQ